jgi:hypothetical protein
MHKDTREELKRLEEQLLSEQNQYAQTAGDDPDAFWDGLLDEHTDSLSQTGHMEYRNFANGYGQAMDIPDPEPREDPAPRRENLNSQLFIASALLVGIAAVLLYWVVRFL